jgi:Domain of unknown function (DUF4388)
MTEHDRQERTDDLETTIHSIESLQQTGVLNIERAKGGVRETATLIFLQGQVVDALIGSRTGQDALDWVITWGSCRYTFDVRFPSEIVVPSPPSPAPVDETSSASSPLGFISQVVQKYTHTADTTQVAEEASTPFPVPRTPSPVAYPLTPIPPIPQTMVPQVEMTRLRAPFRLVNGPEVVNYMERFGLSRLHRHVFFLLDGQRTAVDVVRLTGRSFYEIQHLLADLERLGLIKMEHTSIGEAMNGM